MKRVAVKIEGKTNYKYFYSLYELNLEIEKLLETLKQNEALEIKVGNNHYYIDYENKEWDNHYEYYAKQYLNN
jgi:hypothetical protein